MDFQTILSVSIAFLVVFVVSHLAVFWVVKTMYPPTNTPEVVVTPTAAPVEIQQVFTQPPTEIQHVDVPTFEAAVPAKVASEEGERRGPPPPESTSIRGESGVAVPNAQ